MAEYIAREVLLAQLRAMESYNASPMYRRGYDDCVVTVLNAPAADVVPVVRCKDCKYQDDCWNCYHPRHHGVLLTTYPLDYCSYGERRDGGADND